MAGAGARMVESNIRWWQATLEAGGKPIRVQYLSDHRIDDLNVLAGLVERGVGYGRAWVNGRAQESGSALRKTAEMLRNAAGTAEITENKVAARASREDAERFTSERVAEAAGAAASEKSLPRQEGALHAFCQSQPA